MSIKALYIVVIPSNNLESPCICSRFRSLLISLLDDDKSLSRVMAVIRKTSFTIFPESWADSCGDRYYESSGYKLKERFNGMTDIGPGIPYGWTVGLSVPSEEHIKAEIETLAAELVS